MIARTSWPEAWTGWTGPQGEAFRQSRDRDREILARAAGEPDTFEALECHGGFGFVEDSMMPRFYRETPVQSIWEGGGNVICRDLLRAYDRDPHVLAPVMEESELARSANAQLDRVAGWLRDMIGQREKMELSARRLVETLALSLQASLLLRHSPDYVSDAFCASRLGEDWGHAFGTLSPSAEFKKIIEISWGESP